MTKGVFSVLSEGQDGTLSLSRCSDEAGAFSSMMSSTSFPTYYTLRNESLLISTKGLDLLPPNVVETLTCALRFVSLLLIRVPDKCSYFI